MLGGIPASVPWSFSLMEKAWYQMLDEQMHCILSGDSHHQ